MATVNERRPASGIASREVQASSGSLADPIASAYRLFDALARDAGENDAQPPRFVYVLTDRAPACWDTSRTRNFIAAHDKLTGPPVQQVVIDLGVEKPADVAISDVRFTSQIVPANKPVVLSAIVHATEQDVDTEVRLRIAGQTEVEAKSVKLSAGQTKDVTFSRADFPPGCTKAKLVWRRRTRFSRITLATSRSMSASRNLSWWCATNLKTRKHCGWPSHPIIRVK